MFMFTVICFLGCFVQRKVLPHRIKKQHPLHQVRRQIACKTIKNTVAINDDKSCIFYLSKNKNKKSCRPTVLYHRELNTDDA